ncbi:hypothetical protein MRX96_004876 [Rhipicephalus microplus]
MREKTRESRGIRKGSSGEEEEEKEDIPLPRPQPTHARVTSPLLFTRAAGEGPGELRFSRLPTVKLRRPVPAQSLPTKPQALQVRQPSGASFERRFGITSPLPFPLSSSRRRQVIGDRVRYFGSCRDRAPPLRYINAEPAYPANVCLASACSGRRGASSTCMQCFHNDEGAITGAFSAIVLYCVRVYRFRPPVRTTCRFVCECAVVQ